MKQKYYVMDVLGNWIPCYDDYIDLDKFIISVDNLKCKIIHFKHIYKDNYYKDDMIALYLVLFRVNKEKEEFLIKIENEML